MKQKLTRKPVGLDSKLGKPSFAESYEGLYQTSKMKLFTKIVNSYKPLTIFQKSSILDVSQCS